MILDGAQGKESLIKIFLEKIKKGLAFSRRIC